MAYRWEMDAAGREWHIIDPPADRTWWIDGRCSAMAYVPPAEPLVAAPLSATAPATASATVAATLPAVSPLAASVAALQPNNDEDTVIDAEQCTVCLEHKRCVLMVPCGHVPVCQQCTVELLGRPAAATASHQHQCPVCRAAVTSVVRAFL